jgi:hypothetical protein
MTWFLPPHAESFEAFCATGQPRQAQTGKLRLRLDTEPFPEDPGRFRRDFPPPFPALSALGHFAYEAAPGEEPKVVAHDSTVLTEVAGQWSAVEDA